jgi:hypothetical protein
MNEQTQKKIVIILPFLNEIASLITYSSPPKSLLSKVYVGWRKVLIDFIVLLSIIWSATIVTYDKSEIRIGVIKGFLTLLLSYILPMVFMKKILVLAGGNLNRQILYSFCVILLLVLCEALIWETIDKNYKPESPLRGRQN